jgi:DNA-binding NarL/FixJ family response regulator
MSRTLWQEKRREVSGQRDSKTPELQTIEGCPMRKIDPIQAAHQGKPYEAVTSHDSCNPPKIGVYVVVENRLLREILVRLLRRQGDIELIGEGGSGDTDSTAVVRSGCDVVLVDFVDTEWISEIRQPQSLGPIIKTVVLGMDADSGLFLEAVRCGVTGYLLKDASTFDVLSAVRHVHRGEASCPPQLCTILMRTIPSNEGLRPNSHHD